MLVTRYDPAHPQDFGSRRNTGVDTIVIHTTQGNSIKSAEEWWDREDVVASAHYLLDGKMIVQRVAEGDCAFHAGNAGMNRRSIGIEVVGDCRNASMWTPEVLDQLVRLVRDIRSRHRIPAYHQPGPGICGHRDVPDPHHPNLRGGAGHHTDPGDHFPWEWFLTAVRADVLAAL